MRYEKADTLMQLTDAAYAGDAGGARRIVAGRHRNAVLGGPAHGHRNYLVGWHENPKANHMALFALPHIDAVEILDDTFTRDPGFDLAAFAAHSFGLFQEEPYPVVWRFAPEAAEDAAEFVFHPSQTMERQPDGALIVRFTAGSDLEMAWHLYTWGDKVEVLEPLRLAEMVNGRRAAWGALP